MSDLLWLEFYKLKIRLLHEEQDKMVDLGCPEIAEEIEQELQRLNRKADGVIVDHFNMRGELKV